MALPAYTGMARPHAGDSTYGTVPPCASTLRSGLRRYTGVCVPSAS